MHDPAAGVNTRLTCRVAGVYLIGANFTWSAALANSSLILRLNGATAIAQTVPSSDLRAIALETLYKLAAGDYVEAMATAGGGVGANVNAVPNASPEFWAVRLSA
jgi:hypothetical protein